jgi:hypothetical protein
MTVATTPIATAGPGPNTAIVTTWTIRPAEIRIRRAVTGSTSATTIMTPSASRRPIGRQSSPVDVTAAATTMQAIVPNRASSGAAGSSSRCVPRRSATAPDSARISQH